MASVISNCFTGGGREDYINALKSIDGSLVDSYGSCSGQTCAPKEPPNNCYKRIAPKYKFFLSFENTLCKDYVTEKLFEALRHPWVPIVFGAANYSEHAPPKSVIHAMDYKPAELVELIKQLAQNDTRYLEYFEWKKHYEVMPLYPYGCEMCKKLSEWKRADPPKTKVYDNLHEWWIEKSQCKGRYVI